MFYHWMEIAHNHVNGYLDWLFHQNVFPLRESTSIMSGNGKGFALKELFRSQFTFNSIKNFFKVQWMDF